MSRTSLEVVAKVIDAGATNNLKKVKKAVEDTGTAVRKTGFDFVQFNRAMFATTAFVSLFERTFSSLTQAMLKGAELDRVEEQFERVLGPKGDFINAIKASTTTAIDYMEAMRTGISLKSLGIVQSMGQVVDIVSESGTAAKQAGMDSAEGIKQYTEFLKDGEISHLSFLNILSSTNLAVKAQMEILHRAAGVMGGVLTKQMALTMGTNLLKAATQGSMHANRDLYDTMFTVGQSFDFLRRSVGKFLGTALQPLIEKLSGFLDHLTDTLELLRKNEKSILFFAKATTVAAASVAVLALGLGTLRLSLIALGSLGIGIPAIIGLVVALGVAFLGVTNHAEGFINKLKVFTSFFQGVWQLVSSFFDPDNFEKGIAKIDSDLAHLLQIHGLFNFAKNLARITIIAIKFAESIKDNFVAAFTAIDNMLAKITGGFVKLFNMDSGRWSRSWIDSAGGVYKILSGIASLGLGVKLASMLTPNLGIGSMIGKGIGKVVGAGTQNLGGFLLKQVKALGLEGVSRIFLEVAVIGTAVVGFFKGLIEYGAGFSHLMRSLGAAGSAIFEGVSKFVKSSPLLMAIAGFVEDMYDAVVKVAKFFISLPGILFNLIYEGWKKIGGSLGVMADMLATRIDKFTGKDTSAGAVSAISAFVPPVAAGAVTSIPDYTADRGQQLSELVATKKLLSDSHVQALMKAYKEAIKASSPDGEVITREEWEDIFKSAMNDSEVAKSTKKVADKPADTKFATRTRGC